MFFHVTPEGIERANKIKQALGTALPAGFDKAAKEMTPQEARDALVYLNVNWELHMKELSISDDMKVISPKAEASTRVTLEPNIISGISFLLDSGKDFPLKPVTLAFGVALWRLASELKKDWGVTTIYSGGIGIGRSCSYGPTKSTPEPGWATKVTSSPTASKTWSIPPGTRMPETFSDGSTSLLNASAGT